MDLLTLSSNIKLMPETNLFKTYKTFLTEYIGPTVQKLPVDAGYTCPVRDGTKGTGGCDFCSGSSFVPNYCKSDMGIRGQLEAGKRFFARKYSACARVKYLAYFQSRTNTYADIDVARRLFDEALSVEDVCGLVISTRPDCIDEAWVDCLSSYQEHCFVMVELGVESFDDEVLRAIHRGHSVCDSLEAIHMLALAGIPVGIHLIMGLPHEKAGFPSAMAETVSELPVSSVKLHQLQIVKGANMGRRYMAEPTAFNLYDVDSYVSDVCDFIQCLRPDVALERFVSEMPFSEVIAPKWGLKPDEVQRRVIMELQARGVRQGFSCSVEQLSLFKTK